MPLSNLEQFIKHYTLSTHPRNRSIIDITDKRTGDLAFMKIRHKVVDMYAISLVDPKTFAAYAETHCESATTRSRSIVLHCGDEKNKKDFEVVFKETGVFVFEWCFEWAGEKYRWIRESRRSGALECRLKAGGGDVWVARYVPQVIKDEHFGVMFIPGYNTARLDDQERQILEHILCISLLIILDKSDESNWFTIKRNNTIPLDNNFDTTTTVNTMTNVNNNGTNSNKKTEPIMELPLTPSNSKKEQKRNKIEREVQQKLERDIRRTQKQILFEDNYNVIKRSATNSASSSKNNSPQVSPLPTPNTSTKTSSTTKTLSRQKSTSLLRDRLTINSQLANMKHLDATATLQLPAAAAANNTTTPSLASLFSPTTTTTAPTTTIITNHNKKPASSSSTSSSNPTSLIKTTCNNSASNSTTTSPVTTPTSYYLHNQLLYNAQSASSASSGVAKTGNNSNVVQQYGATSVRWDHHTQQLQQAVSPSTRPIAQRRVSTGAKIPQYHSYHRHPQYQLHSPAQQHIHLQQQQHQQHYLADYYSYIYNQ